MDIEDVRTFLTILDFSSFKLTGERLGRTQAAISLRLQKLEEELGCKLLERKGRSFALTPEGQAFRSEAVRLVEMHDQIRSHFREESASKVTIGVTDDFAVGRLPDILNHFVARNPGVEIELVVDLTKQLFSMLNRKVIDIAVGRVEGSLEPLHVIHSERLIWCSSQRLIQSLPDQLPVVIFTDSYPTAMMLECLHKDEFSYRVAASCRTVAGVRAAVEAGLGITVLLSSAIRGHMCEVPVSWRLPAMPLAQTGVFAVKKCLGRAERSLISFLVSEMKVGPPPLRT